MDTSSQTRCTAFDGSRRIASGELAHVAVKTKEVLVRGSQASVLIFDDVSGEQIEVDFRGTSEAVLKRLAAKTNSDMEQAGVPADSNGATPRGPGRPKLGVVAREVTLLPRHWAWLNSQPGGASVALRKLVEEARHVNANKDRIRHGQEAAYRFMSAVAGNLAGFEEATRALFAGNRDRFDELVEPWPVDVRDYTRTLAATAFLRNDRI